jgi:hypothetical protein
MSSSRRLALATFALVFLVGILGLGKLATRDRAAVTAVATPPPVRLATPIELRRGHEACQEDVALEPDTRVVRIYSASPTPEVPRVRVTLRGDGWSSSALSPEGPGPGSGSDGIYDTPIEPPPRSLLATVCVASAESRPAILAGSREASVRSRSRTMVDGRPTDVRLGLVLLAGSPRSLVSQVKTVLQRAATFHPPIIGWFSLGLLALIVVIAVPAGAVYAALRALREDDVAGEAD